VQTVNEILRDKTIAHEIYLQRYYSSTSKKVMDLLRVVEKDLVKQLKTLDLDNQMTIPQIDARLESVRAILNEGYDLAGKELIGNMQDAAESAQTANIHRSSENSVLASIAQSISIGLTHVMEYLRDWSGVNGDVKIELNRDFIPNSMTAQDIDVLVKSWQAGAISANVLFENLVAGDIISQDTSFDDEQERIATRPATGGLL
jgi:hypothetical protein